MSGAEAVHRGFSPADSLPYAEVHNHQLRGGFTHRLGSRVGQHLSLELHFVETPNRRIEELIQRGRIHLIGNANPEWAAEPQRYRRSPKLYQEADVIHLHDRKAPVAGLQDLYGKVLGTRLGYVYSRPLMKASRANG
ncbi:hypothetical protein [Pseudomonas paeninsulae]|uniref:hypothetical protein n=1 Tax=Pseudomonas paeninsulae TaxID=3110772 RepID=UPI002D770562|nr:hypothetical protein [Pseudomonas sp. IT1137]